MSASTWLIICPCGWSRRVARSVRAGRRRQILERHNTEKHPEKEQS